MENKLLTFVLLEHGNDWGNVVLSRGMKILLTQRTGRTYYFNSTLRYFRIYRNHVSILSCKL